MATAPYNFGVPSVAPEGPPANDYQHVETPLGAFGGFQAEALNKTGASLDQASGQLAQTAQLQQQRYNEIAHQEATNTFLQQVQDITWGTPDKQGVLQKQGADALGAYPQATADIDQARQRIRDGLRNDAQRLAFDQTSRFYQLREQDRIGAHVDAQVRQYAIDTSNAGVKSAAMRAGADPTRDLDTLTREAYLNGTRLVQSRDGAAADPTTVEVGMKVAAGAVVYSRLSALADTNPAAASDLLKSGSIPSPDGKTRIPIQSVLDETGRSQLAQKIDARAAQTIGTGAAMREFQTASGHGANTGPIVATDLPAEAQRFLPALSGGEGNYNSPAPKGDHSGNPIPNNRYQFLRSTWNSEAPKAGVALNDFSPAAQDKVAWQYAQDTYRANSGGRDLASDIRDGGHEGAIATALNKVWPSLPGGSQQNTDMGTWLARLRAQPTTNDAQGPIPGQSRRQALQNLVNNPDLQKNPAAMTHALTMMDHLFTQDDHAVHVDAEAAFNEWIPQVRLNPGAVDPNKVANDVRLTGPQKNNLLALLADKSQGDGTAFSQTFQNIYLPVGAQGRVNSVGDLFSLAGHGLTASGMEKLGKVIKERDQPDNMVQHAAMMGWQYQIEGSGSGMYGPGPVSSANWAQFLGWALPEIEREKGAGKTMAQIVAPTGDIAKAAQHYVLRPDQYGANLGIATDGTTSATPAAPPATQIAPAPQLRAGSYYVPGPNRTFVPADPSNPVARRYNGGPMFAPQGWDAPSAAVPQAPH